MVVLQFVVGTCKEVQRRTKSKNEREKKPRDGEIEKKNSRATRESGSEILARQSSKDLVHTRYVVGSQKWCPLIRERSSTQGR